MKPQTIGRVLGIGVRVTGRLIGQQLASAIEPSTPIPAASTVPTPPQVIEGQRHARQAVGSASRRLAKGTGGFLAPFRRVGGILWLEVTGVFFFLPVVVFGPTLWRIRASYAHGPDHNTFMLTAGVVLVFLYLSVSSFWRARKR
jgi:hypothetical protein